MKYFVLTTRGLEDIALKDLKDSLNIKLLHKGYRRIIFDYNGKIENILSIRSVDDIFILLKTFKINHYRKSLRIFETFAQSTDLNRIVDFIKKFRNIVNPVIFSITLSNIGKKNYTPDEIKESISKVLIKKYKWRFEEIGNHDINIRIFIENDLVIAGIRLGKIPLHRRDYKTESQLGSLKASVAYCLLKLADIKQGDLVLDPFCGVGTIPIEAAKIGATATAIDINKESVKLAKINASNAKVHVKFCLGDAKEPKIPDESIDKIVTNLPFGKQITIKENYKDFFGKVLYEFNRVLKNNGVVIMLTMHINLIEDLIATSKKFRVISKGEISLFGQKPYFLKIVKIAG